MQQNSASLLLAVAMPSSTGLVTVEYRRWQQQRVLLRAHSISTLEAKLICLPP